MNPFTLLYLLYSAKLSSQASIYFIWLVDSSSATIAFIAAAVTVLAGVPFFHVIVHVFSAKPLSNPIFITYLSFSLLFAILWYKPTRDGEQRVLPFAVVTAFDLLDLFLFLFQRKIGHWHDVLRSDVEQGHVNPDNATVALVGRGSKQCHHSDLGTAEEPLQNEIRRLRMMQELGYDINAINRSGRAVRDFDRRSTVEECGIQVSDGRGFGQALDDGEAGVKISSQRPESAEWDSGMLQTLCEREGEGTDLNRRPQQGRGGFIFDLGGGTGSRFENAPLPQTPATVTFDNASRSPSVTVFERNQI